MVGLEIQVDHGFRCPGLGLGATQKVSHRLSDLPNGSALFKLKMALPSKRWNLRLYTVWQMYVLTKCTDRRDCQGWGFINDVFGNLKPLPPSISDSPLHLLTWLFYKLGLVWPTGHSDLQLLQTCLPSQLDQVASPNHSLKERNKADSGFNFCKTRT